MHRLLPLNLDNEPLYVRLYVHPVGEGWAAMILADTVPPPMPDEVKRLGVFGDTAEEAEELAKACLGMAEPAN